MRSLPSYQALVSVAALLKTEPDKSLTIHVQFGGIAADLMRDGRFKVKSGPDGLAFIPFHMPQLRFDEAGEYVARIIDVEDDNYIMATRHIHVATV